MTLDIRPYDRDRDFDAVRRIWQEVAWLENDEQAAKLGAFLDASHVEVGLLDGEAECSVCWTPGTIRYQHTDLTLCAVTAVTTSRLGRKQGLATTMTARALADGARHGAAVAALGIFDQGFYDRLGFGTGPYNLIANLDPAALDLDHVPYRRPIRLGPDDHLEMHQALTRRHRLHGSVVLDPPAIIEAEAGWTPEGFGLGYRSPDDGRLTHFFYASAKGENGPYRIRVISYEEPAQVLELLRLVKELGDQVVTVRIDEPAEIQLQDLVRTPFRRATQTQGGAHANGVEALADVQHRILDLASTVAARSWSGPEVRFNLHLSDPAPSLLPPPNTQPGPDPDPDPDPGPGPAWTGVGGRYTVWVGAPSSLTEGTDPDLPTITATVNAFTRAWLGSRRPSSVALTDHLDGPPDLLVALDEALALPPPRPGWQF